MTTGRVRVVLALSAMLSTPAEVAAGWQAHPTPQTPAKPTAPAPAPAKPADPHAAATTKPADPHAPASAAKPPATKEAKDTKAVAPSPGTGPVAKVVPASGESLKTALERIQERIKAVPGGAAPADVAHTSAPKPAVAPAVAAPAAPAAALPVPATSAVPKRIKLNWRTSLTWPSAVTVPLQAPKKQRVTLVWK